MNDYTDIGVYRTETNDKAGESIANCPISRGFVLIVRKTLAVDSNYVEEASDALIQEIRNYSTSAVSSGGVVWTRAVTNWEGEWSYADWVCSGGVDSIVAEGTSGIWTYRKWANGIAECWGKAQTTVEKMVAWGTVYETDPALSYINFPFSFTGNPAMNVNAFGSGGLISVETIGVATAHSTPRLRATAPNESSNLVGTAVCFDIHVIGRWK